VEVIQPSSFGVMVPLLRSSSNLASRRFHNHLSYITLPSFMESSIRGLRLSSMDSVSSCIRGIPPSRLRVWNTRRVCPWNLVLRGRRWWVCRSRCTSYSFPWRWNRRGLWTESCFPSVLERHLRIFLSELNLGNSRNLSSSSIIFLVSSLWTCGWAPLGKASGYLAGM